jgi:hypothetical protein
MIASPRRFAVLIAVASVVFGLLAFATDATVCLAHRTECAPADESVLHALFLPLVAVVGYVLFRISEAL